VFLVRELLGPSVEHPLLWGVMWARVVLVLVALREGLGEL
jgi:hypothetical protein